MNNGEFIKTLSNEELADIFAFYSMCDFCFAETAECGHGNGPIAKCRQAWRDWIDKDADDLPAICKEK